MEGADVRSTLTVDAVAWFRNTLVSFSFIRFLVDFIPISITIASITLLLLPIPTLIIKYRYYCNHIPYSCPASCLAPSPVSAAQYHIVTSLFVISHLLYRHLSSFSYPRNHQRRLSRGYASHSLSPIPEQSSVIHHQ